MKRALERYFMLAALGTDVRTELVAGVTTFMTMAYIIFVNPAMIAQTGMDFGAAMMATCLSAAFATIMMGVWVNYPIALAPGMGENAFFTYTVCLGMGVPWRVALGCVFIEGLIFIALTLTKMRQALMDSIPESLRHAVACGIGLLIAFVGLRDAGLIVANPATLVSLGDVLSRPALLALGGLVFTGALLARNVKGAILWGILATALAGMPLGLVRYQGLVSTPPSMMPTFLQMDIPGAMRMGFLSIILVFLFMDVFDTVGTLAGVGELGGFIKNGKFPRVGQAMLTDAVGTCAGAAFGTPVVTSFIESASGIACGGRSGLASVVTGLLFVAAVFFSPLIKMIGGGFEAAKGVFLHPVTAPSLIIVGAMMLQSVVKIDWRDPTESIPAFLVIILMPLTFSIATAIAFGFILFAAVKLVAGRGREVPWLIYACAALFAARFVYLKI